MSELPPKDKRTKAYKEWVKKHGEASTGVGDTVQKITKATGIEKAVKFLAGEDCGCDERKDKLNYLFPYQKPNCLTEDEFNYLADRVGKLNQVSADEQRRLLDIYNRVFNDSAVMTNCGTCFLNNVWKKLERVYNEYL
jgi:hypothetical protein